jgi:membrane protein YqaA with SNARE-associated domain
MEDLINTHGYPTLFLLSFLASTLLPLGSEWLLATLVAHGNDPLLSVAVATAGNTLGACTTYWIGLYGGPLLVGKILRIDDESRRRAEKLYGRYGSWTLLFSWVPVVGDPLCLVAGILRARFVTFTLLVLCGKLARYTIVSMIVLKFQGL